MNSIFFESKVLPVSTGFSRNRSRKNALLNMFEKWKHALDKGKDVGTIFMDLFKAFDTRNHHSLHAKLN